MRAARKLRTEEKGVSPIIGLVVVLGLLFGVGLATYVKDIVPEEQRDREYVFEREAEQSFRDLALAISSLESGESTAVSVKLGAEPVTGIGYQPSGATLTVAPARYVDWLSPIVDTYVRENDSNRSSGDEDYLFVSPTATMRHRSYFKFDLKYISPGSYGSNLVDDYDSPVSFEDDVRIESATLWAYSSSLNLYTTGSPQPMEVEVPVMVEARAVDTDGWSEAALTWNNRNTLAPLSTSLDNQSAGNEEWTGWDVTNYVKQEWEKTKNRIGTWTQTDWSGGENTQPLYADNDDYDRYSAASNVSTTGENAEMIKLRAGQANGWLTSLVFDAENANGSDTIWYNVYWSQYLPNTGTRIAVSVQFDNDQYFASPTPWQYVDNGQNLDLRARYVRYRVEFEDSNIGDSYVPEFKDINFSLVVSLALTEPEAEGGGGGGVPTTYDFSSGGGVNKWAKYGTDANGTPPAITAGTEFGSYTEIATPNDVRYSTAGGGAAADPYHKLQFTISEAPATITQLELSWEGYNDGGETSSLYLWNFTTPAWELLGTHANGFDTSITVSRTTGISNYIDASGYLYLCAVGVTNAGITQYTDYVRVTVTVGGGGAAGGSSLKRVATLVSEDAGGEHYEHGPYLEVVFSRGARAGKMHSSLSQTDTLYETGYVMFEPTNTIFPEQQFIYEGGAIIQQQYHYYDIMKVDPTDLLVVIPMPGDTFWVMLTRYRITCEGARAEQTPLVLGGTGWASIGASIAEEQYPFQAAGTPNMDKVTITFRTDHPRAIRDYIRMELVPRLNYIIGGEWDEYGKWVTYDYSRLSITIYGKDAGTTPGVNDIYYTERVVDLDVTIR